MVAQLKTCCTCKSEKQISEFGKNSSRKDGIAAACKDCVKKQNHARRSTEEGKEAIRSYNSSESAKKAQSKYLSNPKTKIKNAIRNARPDVKERKSAHAAKPESKARQSEYSKSPNGRLVQAKRRLNSDYVEAQSAWRTSERGKSILAKWRSSPSGIASARQAKRTRRALINKAEGFHTKEDVDALILRQRSKCACCKNSINKNYHVDHINPLSKGGSNYKENLQILCQRCNNQKHAKHPIDFMQEKGFLL